MTVTMSRITRSLSNNPQSHVALQRKLSERHQVRSYTFPLRAPLPVRLLIHTHKHGCYPVFTHTGLSPEVMRSSCLGDLRLLLPSCTSPGEFERALC